MIPIGLPDSSEADESGEDVSDDFSCHSNWRMLKQMQASSGFKFLALVIGGGITFVFTVVFYCDTLLIIRHLTPDFTGTNVIIVAPLVKCNLAPGEISFALSEGVSVNLPSSISTHTDLACWQAGSMAQAVVGMGLQGTLLFLDASLHETLPRALLAAAALRQRAAVVVWNHASAQHLASRPWVKLLQAAQPDNALWASVGSNLLDDRLAKDISCGKRPHCGCSDPQNTYVDCLAGAFSLVTLPLPDQVDVLRDTIQRGKLSGIQGCPSAAFANGIAAKVLWSPDNSDGVVETLPRGKPAPEIHMLVDCGGDNATHPSKEAMEQSLLNRLWAGVDRYHGAQPLRKNVSVTMANCRSMHKKIPIAKASFVHAERLDPAKLFSTLSSLDVYVTVGSDSRDHVSIIPQVQMGGVAVLSIGNALSKEVFEEGVTGFTADTPSEVHQALESIDKRLMGNVLKRQIHESALTRFSARGALEQVILGLFPALATSL